MSKTCSVGCKPMEKIRLASDSFDSAELNAATEVLQSGFYTMGEKVKAFENAFASWVGAKHSIMVNSGSSANLLLITALLYRLKREAHLQPGDEVLVPALSWPTTVWPIAQLGLVPVIVDVDPKSLAISVESAKKALTPKTKAMFLIHVLGYAANMTEITGFCKDNGILLLEDCCETFGAYHEGKHVGRFGFGGTFSHFFSHQLTTIEGGSIITDDDALADDLRSLRAHGWIRDRSDKAELTEKYKDFDPRFLFVLPGYNVRPMEIQAAIGLVQLKKMDRFLDERQKLASVVASAVRESVPWLEVIGAERLDAVSSRTQRMHSWMNIPFRLKKDAPMPLKKAMAILEDNGIETRPIIAGNLARHPAISMIKHRIGGEMKVADSLLADGFMIGCHPTVPQSAHDTIRKAFAKLGAQ